MGKPRILVIEDEPGIRSFIKRVLDSAYEVRLAADGQDGLKQAQWAKPDLILLDLRMPGLDGLTVLARLKASAATQRIPVVIVSVRGETEMLLEGQRAGAVDQLIKPFRIPELRKTVARQLVLHGEAAESRRENPPQ